MCKSSIKIKTNPAHHLFPFLINKPEKNFLIFSKNPTFLMVFVTYMFIIVGFKGFTLAIIVSYIFLPPSFLIPLK